MAAETVNSSGLKPNSKTIGRDLLAGVNPVFSLNNLMVGTPVAGLGWDSKVFY